MSDRHAPPKERSAWSWIVFVLSVLSVLGAIGLGACSVPMFIHEVEFGGFFWLLATIALGIVTLLVLVVPSWFLYRRKKDRRDRLSLRLSCLTLAILFLNTAALIVFGH
jgi:hypothetical protein